MKKNEKIIVGCIFIVAVLACLVMYLTNNNEKSIIQVYRGNSIVLEIDASINDTYSVSGDYGEMLIEVLDGKVRVAEVECPNHICEGMGWISVDSIMPISCIPNNLLIKYQGDAS